ncbi:MAG: glycosyltransferase family 2 protein [Fuerstiella sp.]|nr:glycosyltransferase family 2 protein [Fuerstiella sp.]
MIDATDAPIRDRRTCFVSVVMPIFNEAANLRQLTDAVRDALQDCCRACEIVYVNDGSTDGSRELLDGLAGQDERIVVVHLSRNFGHQPAVHAGLEQARGNVVILMDSDLQDDPGAITKFLTQWESGFDVVYAQRVNRKESLPKRVLFHGFYRVLNAVAESRIPDDAGNFSLMDRSVVDAMLSLPERDRYLPGLRSWTGFRQTGIPVERLARHDDNPRVSLLGLFKLAKTAIFSFSSFPLTLFYGIAAASSVVCLSAVGFVLYHKALTGFAIPGWTSIIITASFFGALNAFGIIVLGEYVIRIYDQVRARPIYVTNEVRNGLAATAQRPGGGRRGVHKILEDVDVRWNSPAPSEVDAHPVANRK